MKTRKVAEEAQLTAAVSLRSVASLAVVRYCEVHPLTPVGCSLKRLLRRKSYRVGPGGAGHSCSEGRDSDILATSGSGRRVRPAATSAAAVLLCAKKGRFQSDICVPYLPPNGNWASCSTPILFTGWLEETSNFFRAQVEKRKLSATAEDTGPRRCRGRLQLHRDANQTRGTR